MREYVYPSVEEIPVQRTTITPDDFHIFPEDIRANSADPVAKASETFLIDTLTVLGRRLLEEIKNRKQINTVGNGTKPNTNINTQTV